MSDKIKCINTGCDYYDRSQDDGCPIYRDLTICADLKKDNVDASEKTCNLCSGRGGCEIRRDVVRVLDVHRALGSIHNDFDDILADLAAICNNFQIKGGI